MRTAHVVAGAVGALAVVIIVVAIPDGGQVPDHFKISATYHDGHIYVGFLDVSGGASRVSVEIQGMAETFHRTYHAAEFTEQVPFSGPPQYGWGAHPILFDIRHATLGDVLVKTEVRDIGQPPAPLILVR